MFSIPRKTIFGNLSSFIEVLEFQERRAAISFLTIKSSQLRTDSYVFSNCVAEHVAAWTTNRPSPNGFPVVVENFNILPRSRIIFDMAFFNVLTVVQALKHAVLQMSF